MSFLQQSDALDYKSFLQTTRYSDRCTDRKTEASGLVASQLAQKYF
jgi:hypothetical protein